MPERSDGISPLRRLFATIQPKIKLRSRSPRIFAIIGPKIKLRSSECQILTIIWRQINLRAEERNALEEFMKKQPNFVVDDKYLMTI